MRVGGAEVETKDIVVLCGVEMATSSVKLRRSAMAEEEERENEAAF